MDKHFDISAFDSVFSARMTADEWSRIRLYRQHPDFLNGLVTYHSLISDYFSHNIILNKVVTEAWRFEMLVYTQYLYESYDPALPRSGLTLASLQQICARQKVASPGRVLAIVGIMLLGGFLKRQQSRADKRVYHLVPSPEFLAIVEGWNHTIFQIIDAICPQDQLASSHVANPRLGWEMRRRGAQTILSGWKLLDPFPEVLHFVSSDGGWMLLLHCVAQALPPGTTGDPQAVSVDLTAFGKRFAVSRSHLRRLLESAYAAGLLLAPPCNGSDIRLSHRLVASFLTCMASELGNYRLWALAGKAALGLAPVNA